MTLPISTIEAEPRAGPLTLDTLLQAAVGHHKAGDPVEAERLYREVLAADATYAGAHHNLGILRLQTQCPGQALPHLKAALDLDPDQPRYWRSYVEGLMQAGRVADALRVMTEAVQRGLPGEFAVPMTNRLKALAGRIAPDEKHWMPDLPGDFYTAVLDRLHRTLLPAAYLEIGVETGATLAIARCASIGIDPAFRFGDLDVVRRIVAKPSLLLYQMPSDDFFSGFDPVRLLGAPIDFAFLDGMHRCEYLLRDFLHTELHCLPTSVIALHDCLPLETPMAQRTPPAEAIDPFRQGMWTGDVWRTALLLKRLRPALQMTVLDAAPTGLVLITNLDPNSTILDENHQALVEQMLSWSLEQITLRGYYQEMGVEPEICFRRPERLLARLRPES